MQRTYSAVELIAIFTALTVVLGFTFFIGFCMQLGWKLFQFMAPADYITVATTYIFAIPLAFFIGYSRWSYEDFDPDKSIPRALTSWLQADLPALTGEEKLRHARIRLFAVWLLLFPVSVVILAPLSEHFGWHLVPAHIFVFFLIVSSLPYTTFAYVHSMVIERRSKERRMMGLKGLLITSFLAIFSYGTLLGGMIADSNTKNVTVIEKDGSTINGVFVYYLSSGLALKQPGNAALMFLPASEIKRIGLST